jgi:MOSC domain-containing protein YiiM
MRDGRLLAIHVCRHAGEPLVALDRVPALAGTGLEGDRYATAEGTWTPTGGPQRQLTLIESETLVALQRDEGLTLAPADTRRNLLTSGVALNRLVGAVFRVGEVPLRGVKLCEPCRYLGARTGPGVVRALLHRGGLYAEILADGVLHVGDPIHVGDLAEPEPVPGARA